METIFINPAYEITKQILVVLGRGDPYRASLRKFWQDSNANGVIDILELDYEIAGLCQYPDYEIRRIEPLTISVQDGELPQVDVREDFPTVPHLMVSRDGKQRYLCYTDLSYSEIRYRLNGRFIVECINEWLVKTARGELHRDDQPLEPFFYGTQDVIIVNPRHINRNFARFREIRQNGRLMLCQVSDIADRTGTSLYVIIRLSLQPSADNIIHHPPNTLRELLGWFSVKQLAEQLSSELWSILNIRHNPKEFQSLFASTAALFSCPCIITLNIPQRRKQSGTVERSDYRVFLTEGKTFGDVLRDFGIERERANGKKNKKGKVSNKSIDTGKNNLGANIGIRQLNLHWAITPTLAQIYNGIELDNKPLNYVLVGAGALGSQLFAHCLRTGFGKWTIVDNDVVFPHNLARHILTLDSIGQSKASALENYAKSILEDAEVSSIVTDVLNPTSDEAAEALDAADVIVDVSTSVAVERMLAIDIKSKARRISLFLNPCGNYLVMLCEDSERKITLDHLEMQLNSILAAKDDYAEYYSLPSTIAYATSCRDITSRISQEHIALSAAAASKELKRVQVAASANIVIWSISDDGIAADRYDGELWHSVSCGDWRVFIRGSLLQFLQTKRTERQPNETGGVLIGQYDFFRKIIYIADMIFSPDDSIEAPTSYIRGCENLPEQIQQIAKRTYNSFGYVGEWHSHPGSCTAMSSADESLLCTISEVNEAECLLGCMIICGGVDNFSVYIRENSVTHSAMFKYNEKA
jgi:hypothetical protein